MRIVYLVQYFRLPSQSGSSRAFEMSRRLARAGHEVHVVTSDSDALGSIGRWEVDRVDGVTVHRYPVPYHNSMGVPARLRSFVKFAIFSSVRARKLKANVVFASSTPLTIAVPAIASILFRRTPFVFEIRDLWPEVPIALGALRSGVSRWAAFRLQSIAYRSAVHIVALSPQMKEGILAKGVPGKKVSLIPNASDLELFENREHAGLRWRERQQWLGGDRLVLYCGTLGKVNDVRYIVELAARIREIDSTVKFLLVGDGAEKDLVRNRAIEKGVLGENLFMHEGVSKEEVPNIFAAAQITMSTVAQVPALFANSANKLFDSFAAGKPIAINHGGWQAELLESSGAGIVLDGVNLDRAAKDLVGFLNCPGTMSRAGSAASQLARNRFSRDRLAEELLSLLEATQ